MTVSIFWFRNDLRLADNPGLTVALTGGARTALVYILDDAAGPWGLGGASRWWLHHSLQALGSDIAARGGTLLLRRGDPARIIPELAVALKAKAVHAGRAFDPAGRGQDDAIAAGLKAAGVDYQLHLNTLLFAPEAITTKSGGVYGVYTPFSRACHLQPPPPPPIPAPARLEPSKAPTDRLEDWHLLPTKPDWAGGLRERWAPGEANASRRLEAFVANALPGYQSGRNIPGADGTSSLSPHLHFGEISPAAAWRAAASARPGPGPQTFFNELIWREFSHYLLFHHPRMPDQPLRPEFQRFPWSEDRTPMVAWQQGRTGIPIVDAGMRQLWQTGWMHNRMRMVCASFFIKHLLLPWQEGEAWYWDTLVDADLANNSNNWQWVAGCGADAAPYFRIFNPVLQGRKFDPEGAYVRRFVPELARLPDPLIHAPWEADATALAAAGVVLGSTYPRPVIGLAEGRVRALAALAQVTAGR